MYVKITSAETHVLGFLAEEARPIPFKPPAPPLTTRPTVCVSGALLLGLTALWATPRPAPSFDVVIRGGTLYDGTGSPGRRADVGIRADRIVAVGDLARAEAATVVDATALAVAPGFINVLSWSTESLIADGRSQSDIRQGVTTEIFGEGQSMGPVSDEMKRRAREAQTLVRYEITWTSLAEYLQFLQKHGISPNVASFLGAATVRENVLGLADVAPSPEQLEAMRVLVRQEMEAGALGIGSSLIYAPGTYATTEELIELCRAAAPYHGTYISHLRSEGDRLLEAVDELLRISREARIPAEIYHLKAAGEANWPKLDSALRAIESARQRGQRITADMYTYTAAATGFDACLPPWAREGGFERLLERLRDPAERRRILREMRTPGLPWENLCLATGTPEGIVLVDAASDGLKPLLDKSIAEIARLRGTDPESTILDLIVEDHTRLGAVFSLMSEQNVRREVVLPWVSFGSDAASMAADGVFLKSSAHPRAYGNFARLLGRYVREEKLVSLPEAVRRLSGLPAATFGLAERGLIRPGMFADVVVFDPATIADRATYERPHQYAVGVRHVFVNGVVVLRDGEHTGALPGRALRGPGWRRPAA
jgi:N-acyl-D-amino-acid deacylase